MLCTEVGPLWPKRSAGWTGAEPPTHHRTTVTSPPLVAALTVIHLAATAVWFGAMVHSLLVVGPRAETFFGDALAYERFAATLAAGARWKVVGLIAALGSSGGGLVAAELATRSPSALWWLLIGAQVALLLIACTVFAYVSWRLWPARAFASRRDVAAIQRRFRLAAGVLTAAVGAALVCGGIAEAVR